MGLNVANSNQVQRQMRLILAGAESPFGGVRGGVGWGGDGRLNLTVKGEKWKECVGEWMDKSRRMTSFYLCFCFSVARLDQWPSSSPWPLGTTSSTCQMLALTHTYLVSTALGDAGGGGIALAHARVERLLLYPRPPKPPL